MKRKDPVNNIEWVRADTLNPNNYNPNVVFNTELDLLELSILEQGWVQPILASKDGIIIDGFHRWRLSVDEGRVKDRYKGLCPVVFLDIPKPEAMLTTIRMNRAKGSHVAVRMAGIMQELMDEHNYDEQEIATGIGATLDEVRLLYQNSIFKARKLDQAPYSKAWIPKENSKPVENRKRKNVRKGRKRAAAAK